MERKLHNDELHGLYSSPNIAKVIKSRNDELHGLYSSPDIVKVIKSRSIRWAGHVACMGEGRSVYIRVLVGRSEGRRPLGRPRRRWEDNIKIDPKEIGSMGRTGFGWLRIDSGGGLLRAR
jgi:hypothetical protein